MNNEVHDKESMVQWIKREWDALSAVLDGLSEAQMTVPKDAHGWNVCDHMVHIAAWERSANNMLQGKLRHEGLGVSEALWLEGDEDKINDAVQKANAGLTPAAAREVLNRAHNELLALLEPLSTEDLGRPQRAFLPIEPGGGSDRPAYSFIMGNSAGHYAEHLPWIKKIVGLGD
jgi:hypothetical protein